MVHSGEPYNNTHSGQPYNNNKITCINLIIWRNRKEEAETPNKKKAVLLWKEGPVCYPQND